MTQKPSQQLIRRLNQKYKYAKETILPDAQSVVTDSLDFPGFKCTLNDINGQLKFVDQYKAHVTSYLEVLKQVEHAKDKIEDVEKVLEEFKITESKLKEQQSILLYDSIQKMLDNIKKSSLSMQDLMLNKKGKSLKQTEENNIKKNLKEIQNYKEQLKNQLGKPSIWSRITSKEVRRGHKLLHDIESTEQKLIRQEKTLSGTELSIGDKMRNKLDSIIEKIKLIR